ncbi:MAG: hypothetical protein [Bacteriophage sp.]|nr:MAG: hypothetical protein [Bacteriophage sp.]
MKDKIGEVATEVIKQVPPLGVVSFTIMGYPIADWVQLATLLYVVLQAHVLCKKNMPWYSSFLRWIMRGGKRGTNLKG